MLNTQLQPASLVCGFASRGPAKAKLALIFSFLLTISTIGNALGQDQIFGDVPTSAPYYASTALMYKAGITGGCTANPLTYCPDSYATREEVAAFVIRAMYYKLTGNPEDFTYSSDPYFIDVSSSDPLFKYVQKMKELGITNGCTPTAFCPEDSVTNGPLAVFTVRARQYSDTGIINNSIACPDDFQCAIYFNDPDITAHPFYRWIQRARELVGPVLAANPDCEAENFCPDGPPARRGWISFYITEGIVGGVKE